MKNLRSYSHLLLVLLALVSVVASATTISVSPANPDSTTPIQLQVVGVSPVFTPIYFYAFAVVGQTVSVEGCVPPGFETPNDYQFSVNIGALAAGNYTVEYFMQDCGPVGQTGIPYGPEDRRTPPFNFTVLTAGAPAAAAPAIPALQPGALVALAILVALAGTVLYQRRATLR